MLPEWVEQHKKPGTTIKKIGKNYYLYYATSKRVPGKNYPVCEQTYIGKITENGIVQDRVAINISKTRACQLRELIPGMEGRMGDVIALYVKKEWVCTLTEKAVMDELEERGLCHDGKVIFHDI